MLTTHLNADRDGAGSEAALQHGSAPTARSLDHQPDVFSDSFRFLVEQQDWVVPAGSRRARELCDSADLAVVLDTGEVPRIGGVRR